MISRIRETITGSARRLGSIANVATCISLVSGVLAAMPTLSLAAADQVIADFESGLGGWTADGCFAGNPVAASTLFSNLAAWQQNGKFTGYKGSALIHSNPTKSEFNRPSSTAAGTIKSPSFVITHDYVCAMLGGILGPTCYYTLVIDGKEIGKYYGNNNFDLVRRGWDVRAYKGKNAQFVAKMSGGGLVRFDYVHQSDVAPDPADVAKATFKEDFTYFRPGVYQLVTTGPAYSNVHIIKGADGTWHLFGAKADQYAWTIDIMHGTSTSPLSGWAGSGSKVSLPYTGVLHGFTVARNGDGWVMFYMTGSGATGKCGGVGEHIRPQGIYSVRMATSSDGKSWTIKGNEICQVRGLPGHPAVVRDGDTWVVYVAQPTTWLGESCESPSKSAYTKSKDLTTWSSLQPAVSGGTEFAALGPHIPCQVFKHGDYWYMMARGLDSRYGRSRYLHTEVLRGTSPYSFVYTSSKRLLNAWNTTFVVDHDGASYLFTGSNQSAGGLWATPLQFPGEPQVLIGHSAATLHSRGLRMQAATTSFDLTGRRLSSPPRGVVLMAREDGTGHIRILTEQHLVR